MSILFFNSTPIKMSYNRSATIYTDGACSGNGQQGSQGGVGVYWGDNHPNNISRPLQGERQTNQRAEIEAARQGIEQAKSQGYSKVTVRTDSDYVKKGAEEWIPKWDRQGGWSNVKNSAEFQGLRDSMRGIDVEFQHVPSKSNAADHLAKRAAGSRNR